MAAEALPEAWPLPVVEGAFALEHHRMVVAQPADATLAGYYLASVVQTEIELLQLVVAPACRRQGIGGKLLEHLIRHAPAGAHITLEVRASNHAAIALYQHHGFRQIATRAAYYRPAKPDLPREDALVMQYRGHG